MTEIFKSIKGFEGHYEVSNFGKVKSLKNGVERIMSAAGKRYKTIVLYKDGKAKCFSLHNLVWTTFVGPVPEGYEINHMDENPSNNRLDNLNLLTHKQNMNWGTVGERLSKTRTGRKMSEDTKMKKSKVMIGKMVNHPGISKRVVQYTLDDEYVNDYPSTQEAARQTGFSGGCIRECCSGVRKTHKGYKWKYLITN